LVESFHSDSAIIFCAMKQIYEFGDFRADPAEQLLLHEGQPVALTPKVFETLLILLESDGRLIEKDDFISRLWPGVFVEDVALAKNIFHLRKVLADGNNEIEMIQTVPKRGYRFRVPVRKVMDPPAPSSSADVPLHIPGTRARDFVSQIPELEIPTAAERTGKSWRSRKWILASILLLLVAMAAGAYVKFFRSRRVLTASDTVVLADFTNSTGDPVFDGALRQGMTVQLEQSPFLSLISDRRIQQTLRMMGRPPDARLDPDTAREICERTGSAVVLDGSIASLGSEYILGLRAENCRNGDVLDVEQAQAARKEDVLGALDKTAIRLRRKLGESLSSVQKYATPVEEATTPSLEALKAYSLGRKVYFEKGNTAALPFLQRAVELDPNFALAYRAMSAVYGNLNQPQRMAENIRKAYQLRDKVSERERFYIEASYYWTATGELEKAVPAYELWRQTYPRDYAPYNYLAVIYAALGNLEKALEEARESVRLEPNVADNYQGLGYDYILLGRLDEAEAVFKEAERRKLESEGLLAFRYKLAFLKGDAAQMAQLVSTAMKKPGSEDVLLAAQASTLASFGRLQEAREMTRHAMSLAEQSDATETAAVYEARAALFEVEAGDTQQALIDADAAIKLAPNRSVLALAALALARAGDTVGAEKSVAELDKNFASNTIVQQYYLPTISAAVALQRRDPNRAIELLQVTSPTELGDKGYLLPVYVHGEAYLMRHDGTAAAAEFQKFIDRRGVVGNFPWAALARLELGRAYVLSGDKTKATAAYHDFLALWKDADPDVPILKQAKAEFAKLQ
jgi:DNA-binding winged helix-turn-helix (wHTH) protein/tetratricopeptide (TPR) repeat protein